MRSDFSADLGPPELSDHTTRGRGTKEILNRLLAVAGLMRGVPHDLDGPLLAWRSADNHVCTAALFDGFVVGRAPGCDLVLKNIHVSRRHLRFQQTELGFNVVDLNSSNGTTVNGRPAPDEMRILVSGDVIDCGGCGLVFVNGSHP